MENNKKENIIDSLIIENEDIFLEMSQKELANIKKKLERSTTIPEAPAMLKNIITELTNTIINYKDKPGAKPEIINTYNKWIDQLLLVFKYIQEIANIYKQNEHYKQVNQIQRQMISDLERRLMIYDYAETIVALNASEKLIAVINEKKQLDEKGINM